MQVRKMPVVVDAVQWNGGDLDALRELCRELGVSTDDPRLVLMPDGSLDVQTTERAMVAVVGSWVIKGVEGELYPCSNSVFRKTYDLVNNRNSK